MRQAIRTLRLVLLLLAVVPRAVVAQGTNQTTPAGRFTLGTFSFTPGVLGVVGHDTNLTRVAGRPGGGEFYDVAQVEAWWKPGRLRVAGAAAIEFQRHINNASERAWNNAVDLNVSTIPGRLRPAVTYSRHNHYAPPDDFVGFELSLKSRRIETETEASLGALVGARTSLVGLLRLASTRYDADAVYEGVRLQESLNRSSVSGGVSLEHELTRQTTLFGSAEIGEERFQKAPIRDGSTSWSYVGLRTEASAFIAGMVAIGRRTFTSHLKPDDDFDGVAWLVDVAMVRPRITALIDVKRDYYASFNVDQGRYVSTGGSVYVSAHVTPRLDGYVTTTKFNLRYAPGATAISSAFATTGTGAAYRFNRFIVGVTSEWYVQHGAGPYSGRRVTTYVRYGGERIRRLDRPLPGEHP